MKIQIPWPEAVKTATDKLSYPIRDVDLIVGATYTPYDTVGTLAHAVQRYFNIARARSSPFRPHVPHSWNAVEIVEGYFATNKSKKPLLFLQSTIPYSDDMDEQSGHLWVMELGLFLSQKKTSDDDIKILDLNTTGLGHIGKGTEGVYLRPNEGGLKMPFGKDIFVNASKYMISEVKCILKKNHLTLDQIVHLIPHQANSRIIAQVAEGLELRNGELIVNIEDMGNTGCASTIIGLSQNWSRFKKGELIVITVFGGGYSSGAMLLRK